MRRPNRLSKAALASLIGISVRSLTRLHQQGFVTAVERRRGLGRGRGTTPLKYSRATEVPKLKDLKILRREFKNSIDWRCNLWLKHPDVRIAPDLADTLDRLMDWFRDQASSIEPLDDIETICAGCWNPADMPRSNPLRKIFKGLNPKEMRALMRMLLCIISGVRSPELNEAKPYPFEVCKRVFGLPKEWQMPAGLFDTFPRMHKQITDGLRTAKPDELKAAWRVCRFLDRVLGEAETPKRDAAVIAKADVPEQPIRIVASIWSLPVVRAATMGLIIFGIREYRSAIAKAGAAFDRSVDRIFKFAVFGRAGNPNACR